MKRLINGYNPKPKRQKTEKTQIHFSDVIHVFVLLCKRNNVGNDFYTKLINANICDSYNMFITFVMHNEPDSFVENINRIVTSKSKNMYCNITCINIKDVNIKTSGWTRFHAISEANRQCVKNVINSRDIIIIKDDRRCLTLNTRHTNCFLNRKWDFFANRNKHNWYDNDVIELINNELGYDNVGFSVSQREETKCDNPTQVLFFRKNVIMKLHNYISSKTNILLKQGLVAPLYEDYVLSHIIFNLLELKPCRLTFFKRQLMRYKMINTSISRSSNVDWTDNEMKLIKNAIDCCNINIEKKYPRIYFGYMYIEFVPSNKQVSLGFDLHIKFYREFYLEN